METKNKIGVSGQNDMPVQEDIDSRVVRKDMPTLVEIGTCSVYANRISGYSGITAVGREWVACMRKKHKTIGGQRADNQRNDKG